MEYRVVVTYDTGNTFHTEHDKKDVAFVTENLEEANEVVTAIREHEYAYRDRYYRMDKGEQSKIDAFKAKYPSEWQIDLTLSTGKKVDIYVPWIGYFEHFTSVEVVTDSKLGPM